MGGKAVARGGSPVNDSDAGCEGLPPIRIAETLFSRVQMRVLALIYGNPDRAFQGAELIRLAGSGVGAVHRELKRLVSAGLVSTIPVGKRRLYQANRSCPVFEELHGLIVKTVGIAQPIREALGPFSESIRLAFIYGSTARGDEHTGSDVDIMIIGDNLAYPMILEVLQPVEKVIGRQISVNLMTPAEWVCRMASGDSFVSRIAARQKIVLTGSLDVVESA